MRTVVVTAVGSFSAPAVIRSLQEAGYRVVGTDYNPQEYLANSVAVDRFVRVPGFREEEALLQVLEGLMKEEHAEGLIPLTDAELDLLDKNRDRFPEGSLKRQECRFPEGWSRHFGEATLLSLLPATAR